MARPPNKFTKLILTLEDVEAALVAFHNRPRNKQRPEALEKRAAAPVRISPEDSDLLPKCDSLRFGKYVYANMTWNDHKNLDMHRMIAFRMCGRILKRLEVVDHHNGNTLDNRRENLRICNYRVNNSNRVKCVSESGYFGVHLPKNRKTYEVAIHSPRIGRRSKKITRFGFARPEEAALAYNAMARELGYSTMNFRFALALPVGLRCEALRKRLKEMERYAHDRRNELSTP